MTHRFPSTLPLAGNPQTISFYLLGCIYALTRGHLFFCLFFTFFSISKLFFPLGSSYSNSARPTAADLCDVFIIVPLFLRLFFLYLLVLSLLFFFLFSIHSSTISIVFPPTNFHVFFFQPVFHLLFSVNIFLLLKRLVSPTAIAMVSHSVEIVRIEKKRLLVPSRSLGISFSV